MSAAASGSTAASEPTAGPSTFTNPLPTAAFALSALAADDAEAAVRDVKDSLLRRVGFAPWIGPTQAPTPEHSAGLFLKGAALPGTVVALYPGATFAIDMRMRVSRAAAGGGAASRGGWGQKRPSQVGLACAAAADDNVMVM